MAAEGFRNDFNFDLDNMLDKTFHSFRKSKTNNINNHWKWNPFNLVNKHYTRNADQVYDLFSEANVTKRIYQARPNLVLNIGNEYLAMNLMEDLASKFTTPSKPFLEFYKNSPLDMPKRHILTRFVRDFKEFTLPMFDFAHYTVPL